MRTLLGAGLLVGLGGCGAVCGNHQVESGEQCDDGNTVSGDGCSSACTAEAANDTFIHFDFVATEFPTFSGETCLGLAVSSVKLELTGPKPVSQTLACDLRQAKLSYLPLGDYTVSATAYDAGGNVLTRGLSRRSFTASTASLQDVTVDFSFEDFTRSYTGTYFFKTTWGGASTCADASPPVARQRLRLERDGAALDGMTDDGTPLDGSRAGPCHGSGESGSQFAKGLPWGPAVITVIGEDEGGQVAYRKTFDTFVGADLANPTALLEVSSILPDAGVADAPLADAGSQD